MEMKITNDKYKEILNIIGVSYTDESIWFKDSLEKVNKALNTSNVRISLPLTNQHLWDMAKTIIDKQKEAIKITKPIDLNILEGDWFDWLEENIFGNKS